MKLIARLDQHAMNLFDDADSDITFTRRAARAVLTNEEHQIAVMHLTKTGFYKLPGGGIDEGEEIEAALRREIIEETGYEINDVRELGVVEEYRYYRKMRQTSYCYLARAASFVGTSLTAKEAAEGMNLRWAASIDEAIGWIQSGHVIDEDGSEIGLAMMKTRDIAILEAARILASF